MNTLLIGAGVIGTVYGANVAAAGHRVSVYAHGGRSEEVARHGLRAKDVATGKDLHEAVDVVRDPTSQKYDLTLVSSVDGSRVARAKLTQWHWSGAVFCPAC
jgi:ketopantoate reductase